MRHQMQLNFNLVIGMSRGGMVTYLALQKSDKIKTANIEHRPTDLFGII